MNTSLLRRARRHFFHPQVPAHTARHNARAWAKSLRFLGQRWLLAQPVERKQ